MYPRAMNLVRLIWLLAVCWYELGTFYHHTSNCPWPDDSLRNSAVSTALPPTHVLVVADPQILDRSSYPDRPPWLVRLSQFIVDLNLRKSWRAAMRRRPDAVVILGDMMDNGRLEMSDEEYEAYVRRFKSIFPASSGLPVYYLPGNHDVGLGVSSPEYQFSDHAVERYTSHFGVLNQRITIANHTVWLLNAPGLVDEDRERAIAQMSYSQWAAANPDRTIAFVQRFSQHPEYSAEGERPIFFSHVPLFRPEGTSCGPLRERGTIRQGRGLGYQNLLPAQASQFLLANIRPAIIFSGDDHDYCEYVHSVPTDAREPSMSAPEITVKSFSMAMGIRRPGYQLLSLVPPTPDSKQASPTFAHRPCLLPDQLGIYLSVYIPLFCLTLLALLAANVRRVVSARTHQAANRSGEYIPLGERGDDEPETDFDLPPPSAWRSKGFPRQGWSWSFTVSVGGHRRRFTLSKTALFDFLITFLWKGDAREDDRYRQPGVMRGLATNLRDAAWAPLALFVLIAWWVW